jgi:endonuclease-3
VPTRPPARAKAPAPKKKTRPAPRRSATKDAATTRRILAGLEKQHPNADTELNYRNPFELLAATILSAQCTDERVNQVTPALFARYGTPRALAGATPAELEPIIKSTGFFRAKSKSLIGMATAITEHHGGEVPRNMEALVQLPGVGRKTANVVLGHALGVPGLPVDRHVLRVTNRIGVAAGDDPVLVEQQLCAALPPPKWIVASDTFILHGRRVCKPRPLCDKCAVREECDYYRAAMGAGGGSGVGKSVVRGSASPQVRESAVRKSGSPQVRRSAVGKSSSLRGEPNPKDTAQVPMSARTPKARGRGLADGSELNRSETGSVLKPPQAAKLRGTGRGGGAPRQTK